MSGVRHSGGAYTRALTFAEIGKLAAFVLPLGVATFTVAAAVGALQAAIAAQLGLRLGARLSERSREADAPPRWK